MSETERQIAHVPIGSPNGLIESLPPRRLVTLLLNGIPGDVIYVRLQLTSDPRRQLTVRCRSVDGFRRPSFFVCFVPFCLKSDPRFGPDLREYFRTRPDESDMLTTAAQATLLYLLLDEDAPNRTVNGLAGLLGYSKMTISRAFTEREISQLDKVETRGHHTYLSMPWQQETQVRSLQADAGGRSRVCGAIGSSNRGLRSVREVVDIGSFRRKMWTLWRLEAASIYPCKPFSDNTLRPTCLSDS